jgi:hypothetical protein
MEKFARDKPSRLLRKFLNYGQQSFVTLSPLLESEEQKKVLKTLNFYLLKIEQHTLDTNAGKQLS